MKKPTLYKNYLRVILESYFQLNYYPTNNFHDLLTFFGEEVIKNKSLDGLNNMILILFLANHRFEIDFIKIFIEDFHKLNSLPDKKPVKNKTNMKLILNYLQAKYSGDENIKAFINENKEFQRNQFSKTFKSSLLVFIFSIYYLFFFNFIFFCKK